jgi:hypothetical protein
VSTGDIRDALTWEELPRAGNRGRYDWDSIVARLRSNPGEWMLIYENGPRGTANAIRQGHIAALRPGTGIEITTRNNVRERATCSLYLRYVPPGSQ